ncbi:peptidoglycan-binding protein [Knoellia subterranea]|uniref:Peptidoglycan-binding protein n=1 Tax=Knoellia subterranea KCTC 19937 TaxID=1385521 RepID=A0A0A0JJ37_9MICO|nr:peptidoglycan-binding protein [Knoellia subterranea]KGN36794.1 peptidoglycan-binding protein [Knoellia subterranea KCTC 19937]
MTLAQIAAGTKNVSVQDYTGGVPLAKEFQNRLTVLGCLDPPADGSVGPVTKLVVPTFAKVLNLPAADGITPAVARAMLSQTAATFLPWSFGNDFPSKLVRFMLDKGFFVARLPGFLTIVYIEGADENGRPNPDKFNQFNDRRIVLRREPNGRPVILHNALATTEPGKFFTENPPKPEGAARIAFGQYKAWRVGFHKASQSPPTRHEALVQVGNITIHRDKNKDGKRVDAQGREDKKFTGDGFGINQHNGHDNPVDNVGKTSAGCLVGRSVAEHKEFMALVKTDPRFRATKGYVYLTTVLNGDHFGAFA